MSPEELIKLLFDNGVPCFINESSSVTRMGRPCCFYCDEPMDIEGPYHDNACLWLEIIRIANAS